MRLAMPALVALVVLAAGCTGPEIVPQPGPPPPAPGPGPVAPVGDDAGPDAHGVRVTLLASAGALRPGQRVNLTATATNEGPATVRMNPGEICGGSWVLTITDPQGERVRTNDIDSMGCATMPYSHDMAPGDSQTLNESWSGRAHPRPGGGPDTDVPPGSYVVAASFAYRLGDATFEPRANVTLVVQ